MARRTRPEREGAHETSSIHVNIYVDTFLGAIIIPTRGIPIYRLADVGRAVFGLYY